MLNTEYKTLREKVSFLESKISNPQAGGITNVINEIASPLGIKNKVKSIKNVTNRQLKEGFSEETADIVIEKITLNELINIYYKIQDMPTILSIKKTNIKKTFESPQLLDLEITLSLYQLKQETKR
ncbi:MAG: hypothetical protein N2511_00435 [Thermodesulfovibrionales bacterium]|nr:hypothetical protein [Thermodesulfovibrionales bacterium]